jgi:hypothetical protein
MEQVVDGLRAHQDPELAFEDPANVGGAEGTDAVLGRRRGVEPLPETGVVLRVQGAWPSGPGAFAKGLDAAAVVLGDPVLDRAERGSQALGDLRGGPPLLGEDDGLDSLPRAFLGDSIAQDLELGQGVMFGDEHG